MRSMLVVLLVVVGCSKKQPTPAESPPAPAAAAPAAKPVEPARPKPDEFGMLSKADACCCITRAVPDGDIGGGTMDRTECAKQSGTCKTPWTDSCDFEYTSQSVANQRNAADADCPSHDRHDCDGDGFRAGEDKDDNDPKVH